MWAYKCLFAVCATKELFGATYIVVLLLAPTLKRVPCYTQTLCHRAMCLLQVVNTGLVPGATRVPGAAPVPNAASHEFEKVHKVFDLKCINYFFGVPRERLVQRGCHRYLLDGSCPEKCVGSMFLTASAKWCCIEALIQVCGCAPYLYELLTENSSYTYTDILQGLHSQ